MLDIILPFFIGIFLSIMIFISIIVLIILDGSGYINVWSRPFRILSLLTLSHPVTVVYFILYNCPLVIQGKIFLMISYALLAGYLLMRLHFFPARKNASGNDRYFILYGAKIQISAFAILMTIEFLTFFLIYHYYSKGVEWIVDGPFFYSSITFSNVIHSILFWDFVVVSVFLFFICFNASARVLVTSKRLGRLRRVITFFGLLIPGINIYFIYHIYRIAKEEYATECCRYEVRKQRKETDICDTKYPIILIHGIAFRDFQYINYWGRIPKILAERGADIYYGHQQAWDTIENNARHIKESIDKVLEETGSQKVNIIAHSKGGLDARYLIHEFHMEEKVASLTTISTPHRGSGIIEVLEKFPDKFYRKIAGLVDASFKKVGDMHPDCYHASKQLSRAFCAQFNERYPNSNKVYYQSYASVMKGPFSDYILAIPYCILLFKEKCKNDGLVTVKSAKWGNFKKVFTNKHIRGISHVDMIDLRRDDIFSFDVLEEYIQIVKELKEMGY